MPGEHTRMTRRKDLPEIEEHTTDDALYHRLLEIIPAFPSDELPMDIGQFFQSHIAQGDLDCRKSQYGSVSKWMKAMERDGLVLMKKVGRKGPARVVAVGPSQVALFRSHKKPEVGLTASNLAKLTMSSTETDAGSSGNSNASDGGSEHEKDHALEVKSIAISEAMSMATTSYSVATMDYNIQPTIHARQRQYQRGIDRHEIQSAVKTHAVTSRARDGRRLIQGDNGVSVVVAGGEKNTVITTWRDDDGDPTENWREVTAMETKTLLPSSVIKMFPFLFSKDSKAQILPMDDTAVLLSTSKYFESSMYGTGRLREVAYLVATKDEWVNNNRRTHLTPQKRVSLYVTIIELLKAGEELDGEGCVRPRTDEEVLELFGERGSQRFWNKLNPALDESSNRHLKHRIKELIKHEKQKQQDKSLLDCSKFLLRSDAMVAPTPEDLADLVTQLSSTCHRVVGSDEWRDGRPPIVTIGDCFERYTHGKRGAWKAGDVVVKHHKRRKRIIIVGLKDSVVDDVTEKFRRIAQCPCSIKALDYAYWMSLYGENVDPMAEEGSRAISLSMAEGSEALFPVMQILEEVVPQEYRRYLSEDLKTIEAQPLDSADGNIYQDMIQESTSIELTEIYRKHAPDKIKDVPSLLKKYAGKEEKLLKVVRKKYVTGASRLNVVPEHNVAGKEDETNDAPAQKHGAGNESNDDLPKKATVPTWETDDFSAFM